MKSTRGINISKEIDEWDKPSSSRSEERREGKEWRERWAGIN